VLNNLLQFTPTHPSETELSARVARIDIAEGKPFDGAHRYTIRFAPDQMPPAKQFWLITMYNLPERLLVANPLNRDLLNTPMRSR